VTADDIPPIRTARLTLESMSAPFMAALQSGDLEAAAREIGAAVTPWLPRELEHFLRYRLEQLAADPSARPWLGRAIVLETGVGSRQVIGSVGFHGPPDSAGRLEVGYSIDPDFRRRGYALEAVRAIFDWAHEHHGISRFVASISPDNAASLGLVGHLAFRQTGEQIDDIDGRELIFEGGWPLPEATPA